MMMENLDHVYCNTASTDVGGKESPEQISLFKEVKQLQSILLLHLDLIQEQSDQILAKDKLIIKLKDENELLKHQLELVNKRMQQMKQQKEQREISIPVRSIPVEKVYDFTRRVIPSIATESTPNEHILEVSSTVTNIKKEVISNDYDNFDAICSDFGGELESDIKIENNEIEEEIFLNYSKSDDESGPSNDGPVAEIDSATEERPPSSSTPISYGVSISSFENITNTLESTSNSNNNNNSNITGSENNQLQAAGQQSAKDVTLSSDDKTSVYNPICSSGNSSDGSLMKKSCRTSYMITQKPYITCNWKDEAITNELERLLENEAAELEIPCWTVVDENYDKTPNTSEQTSENISEEAYMKRHFKFELDERRRKKWDVQRIREQKTIERLKKRHLKTDADNEQKNIVSFYPSIETIKYVHITEEIPVQAFGEPIPILPTSSFSLPWMTRGLDTTESVTPSEFGPGPLFSASTVVPSTLTAPTTSTIAAPAAHSGTVAQDSKTKFLHRLAPNLHTQKQRFTKRVKKET
ncbi:protein male-specific lethal-1-like [Wyeomyia smithii]|uniref:protein male-specific lethal-1-like n=1 Tax=Wyeomyia smithii TaxID=174621 RepID=UPI002467DCF4|nr:protein male-specific lethal-1-like [Wyeomyia smithii]XP_055540677.1 protein male-specific lethal-1-like [Wyeomyia smithii]